MNYQFFIKQFYHCFHIRNGFGNERKLILSRDSYFELVQYPLHSILQTTEMVINIEKWPGSTHSGWEAGEGEACFLAMKAASGIPYCSVYRVFLQ
jgi:hypothetical protein